MGRRLFGPMPQPLSVRCSGTCPELAKVTSQLTTPPSVNPYKRDRQVHTEATAIPAKRAGFTSIIAQRPEQLSLSDS